MHLRSWRQLVLPGHIAFYYMVLAYSISDLFCCDCQESVRFESKGSKHKEIKTVGVQTDLPGNNEYLEHKKVLVDRISSNLCAVWGMPTNSLMGRSLISKILVSCSEEILTLVQSTGSLDKCEASSEASSSVRNAISQVYDIIIKVIDMPKIENIHLFLIFLCFSLN